MSDSVKFAPPGRNVSKKPAMDYHKCWGLSPEERFVTSCSSAFKPPAADYKKSQQGQTWTQDSQIPMEFQLTMREEKDAQGWKKCIHLHCFRASSEPKDTSLQPATKRHMSCSSNTGTMCPDIDCFKMQAPQVPENTTQPQAQAQTTHGSQPSSKPLVTEYQINYSAKWVQPKHQQ